MTRGLKAQATYTAHWRAQKKQLWNNLALMVFFG
jgi:hypothetical protein